MPLHGYQFTWFKSIGTPSSKEARIDRALVTSSWQTLNPNAALQTLVASISDHTPLLLQLLILYRGGNLTVVFGLIILGY